MIGDSMMTIEEEPQVKLLPFPRKYIHIDKRYRFSKRAKCRSLFIDYPLSESQYKREWSYGRRTPRPASWSPPNAVQLAEKALPDVVLLTIFKYMHPIDLINGVSQVSSHWNALAKTSSLYRHVRVLINQRSVQSGSAKRFLERGCNQIEKLCMVYEDGVFADVFPDCMPKVETLDISFFPDLAGSIDKLISCFPSVETLIMRNVCKTDQNVTAKVFSKSSFKKLRYLCCYLDEYNEDFFRRLSEQDRHIEHLETGSYENLRSVLSSSICETLTHLIITAYISNESFAVIGQLKNLTMFSLFSALYATDVHLMELKSLSKLEHLHLDCCGEDCDMSRRGIAEFFRLPAENSSAYFPSRLKYLCLSDLHAFNLEAAQEIAKSCPHLISLNVSRNQFMGEEALSVLLKNLRDLKFLDMSELYEMKCDALRNLSDDDLPQLRYLSVKRTPIKRKILETLNLRRPNLYITNRSDYFINWDIRNGKPCFNKHFDGDMNAVLNDLTEIDGFCCMTPVTI